MYLEGHPFMPPGCPSLDIYQTLKGVNLDDTDFELAVDEYSNDPNNKASNVEVYGSFAVLDDEGDAISIVETEVFMVPSGSVTAEKARYAGNKDVPDRQALVRRLLGQRVMRCRGPVDGKCWAMKEPALQDIVEWVATR